jgi:hypothetical protein
VTSLDSANKHCIPQSVAATGSASCIWGGWRARLFAHGRVARTPSLRVELGLGSTGLCRTSTGERWWPQLVPLVCQRWSSPRSTHCGCGGKSPPPPRLPSARFSLGAILSAPKALSMGWCSRAWCRMYWRSPAARAFGLHCTQRLVCTSPSHQRVTIMYLQTLSRHLCLWVRLPGPYSQAVTMRR